MRRRVLIGLVIVALAGAGLAWWLNRPARPEREFALYGNVVRATHGETRFEVLGSGDAGKAFQAFTLKQPPLTWVSAQSSR